MCSLTIKKHCKNVKRLWWEQLSQITSVLELIQLGGNIWYYECTIFGCISGCSVLFHHTTLCKVTFVNILVPWLQVSNYNLKYTFHIQDRKRKRWCSGTSYSFYWKRKWVLTLLKKISLYISFSRTVSCSFPTCKQTDRKH